MKLQICEVFLKTMSLETQTEEGGQTSELLIKFMLEQFYR